MTRSARNMPEAEAVAPAASTGKQRIRRKALESGFSLLARGEPQIWLTGGMLAICLAMIASLMMLIIASGLPTFWPRQVDWLVLRDGTFEMGELQLMTAVDVESDASLPVDGAKSYYYRTENFDITNRHYRWLEPEELRPEGIVRIPATTLVERLEWGYLFGIPLRLHEQLQLSASDQQQWGRLDDARRLLEFIAASSAEASSESGDADEVATQIESLNRAQEYLNQQLIALQDAGLRRSLETADEQVKQAQLVGDNSWKLVNNLAVEDRLQAARVVVVNNDQLTRRLSSVLPTVQTQRKQLTQLKRKLSRADAEISKLRIAVRQAELDSESVLPVQLDAVHNALEQLQTLEMQAAKIAGLLQQLPQLIQDKEFANQLKVICDQFNDSRLPAQRKSIVEQLAAWRRPLDKLPQSLRAAVARYEAGYAELFVEKEPIQTEILSLQKQLAAGEVIFAVPSISQAITGLSDADASALSSGAVSSHTAEQLRALDVNVVESTGKVNFSQKPIALISVVDANQLNHLVSTVDVSYLSDEVESSASLLGEHAIAYEQLVRVIPVNQLNLIGKLSVYFSRWGEFLFEDPREANTLGGVFPAIWGTIVMTLIMTIAVVPFGVMAALYLREYTRGGPLVSLIRISINNLAGVPSIVYGVFGFSFFCMTIGSFIDGGPAGADIVPWPTATWYSMLALTVIVGTAAFFANVFSSGPSHSQTRFTRLLGRAALFFWLACLGTAVLLVFKSPFFEGLYAAQLPNPTFGKGGLLWASLTLALLTLPVVIVATEEALSAVPNSLREGSLACGASKWQTIRRIVLPHARPGILTGAILAMARGAGEVAPLMLVGALPNAPELPLDGEFPFFHGSRNFMHLGYQIYSLGFQSQNSEAAKPMVFTCTLLLILIVAVLNISAIFLRSRLRRRFLGNQF